LSETNENLAYLSVDDSYVQEVIAQLKCVNLLNLNNLDGISTTVDKIIDKFSGGIGSLIT